MLNLGTDSEGSAETMTKTDVVGASESHQAVRVFSLFSELETVFPQQHWTLMQVPSIKVALVLSKADAKEAVSLLTDTQDMPMLPELGLDSEWLMLLSSG